MGGGGWACTYARVYRQELRPLLRLGYRPVIGRCCYRSERFRSLLTRSETEVFGSNASGALCFTAFATARSASCFFVASTRSSSTSPARRDGSTTPIVPISTTGKSSMSE